MSDPSSTHDSAADDAQRLPGAVRRWSAAPDIAPHVAAGTIVLVLDAAAERVLYASEAGRSLQSSLVNGEGRILQSVGLPAQIHRIGELSRKPKLARLRFDRRGIAVPTTCRLAQLDMPGGAPVLLITLPGPVAASTSPGHEDAAASKDAAVASASDVAPSPSTAPEGNRLVWRSDAFGVITQASGLSQDIASALIGRSLASLQGRGRNGLLAALDTRQSFGPVAIVLTSFGSDDAEIELSGAPASQPPDAFSGYLGFGTLRASRGDRSDAVAPTGAGPSDDRALQAASAPQGRNDNAAPQAVAPARQLDLSLHEHAAFREIARALGARFAGDDEAAGEGAEPLGAEAPEPGMRKGDVAVAAAKAALEGLPAGVLIRQGTHIPFVSRLARDVLGFVDDEAVASSDRARGLFDATRVGADAALAFERPDGKTVRLQVDRSTTEWRGERADLLLLRVASEPCAVAHGEATEEQRQLGDENTEAAAPPTVVEPDLAMRSARDRAPHSLRARVDRLLSDEVATSEIETRVATPSRLEAEHGERLRRADVSFRQKFDFFTKASQEIRAPVHGMLSAADAMLMEQSGPLGDHYRTYLREIQDSGGHALAHLDDLVSLARIEAGRTELSFAALRINDLVSSCIAELQSQAARDRIVMRTSLSPDLRTLLADERSMRKAALGVLAHALRQTEAGGQIIVSTNLDEHGAVMLRVRDSGAGLSAEEIEQALEPFRHRPPVLRDGTTGLGLTLIKALVEANRGRFLISSRKNEGTLVELVFPPDALSA